MKNLNEPRDHHYAPQFYLRNFAVDDDKRRVTTVGKHGKMAIWAERSIEGIGFERDFYIHTTNGIPVSVETRINQAVEIPISQSDTWKKISSNRADTLDEKDRPVLYALIRHLEARTPHYLATMIELATMAADENSTISFTQDERSFYSHIRANPDLAKATLNNMAATTAWTEASFKGAMLSIYRSSVPLRTSTTPVFALPVPPHAKIAVPLPGMTPFQLVLPLNQTTMACLIMGDFDGSFSNVEVPEEISHAFNRHFVGQFAKFDHVQHLITNCDSLIDDMTWAPYSLIGATPRKITFERRMV